MDTKIFTKRNAHFPSDFLRHFYNKEQKHRANMASEPVTLTLATEKSTVYFSSFEEVSQSAVKECILYFPSKSCDLDPTPSNLLINSLDYIPHSLTYLLNCSLTSEMFPHCFKSGLVTPIIKKRCFDHNDLSNY